MPSSALILENVHKFCIALLEQNAMDHNPKILVNGWPEINIICYPKIRNIAIWWHKDCPVEYRCCSHLWTISQEKETGHTQINQQANIFSWEHSEATIISFSALLGRGKSKGYETYPNKLNKLQNMSCNHNVNQSCYQLLETLTLPPPVPHPGPLSPFP